MMARYLSAISVAVTLTIAATAAKAACPTFHQLQNGTTADASQVMDNFNNILECPSFTGNVEIGTTTAEGALTVANTSGTNIVLDKPGGASLSYARSGTLEFLIEDDSASTGALGFYSWTGSTWNRLVDFASNGNVGIGTASPTAKLDIVGTVNASGGYTQNSDARLKKDITPLGPHMLDIVMGLKPVTFRWKKPLDVGMQSEQFGFIAQDVEKILPTMVTTRSDARKTKTLNYNEFIPVLTKALQELATTQKQLQIRQRRDEQTIAILESQNKALRAKLRLQKTNDKSISKP